MKNLYLSMVLLCPLFANAMEKIEDTVPKTYPKEIMLEDDKLVVELNLPYRSLNEAEKNKLVSVYEMFTGVLTKESPEEQLLLLPSLYSCIAVVVKNMRNGKVIAYHDYFDPDISFKTSAYVSFIKKELEHKEGDKIIAKIYTNFTNKDDIINQKINIILWQKTLFNSFKKDLYSTIIIHQPQVSQENLIYLSNHPFLEINVLVDKNGDLYNTCPHYEHIYDHIKLWNEDTQSQKEYYENILEKHGQQQADKMLIDLARDIYLRPYGGKYEFSDQVDNECYNYGYYQSGILRH